MSAEFDPLLPKNRPAPEISGYGYSTVPSGDCVTQEVDAPGSKVDDDEPEYATSLNSIFALFTIVVGVAFIFVIFVSRGFETPHNDSKNETRSLESRVNTILSENPLIDGHNDLAIMIRFLYGNRINSPNFKVPFEDGGLKYHVDIPRLKAGKVGGTFWSAFVGCPRNGTDFSDSNYIEAVSTTLSQLDLLRRLSSYYPLFTIANQNISMQIADFKERRKIISPYAIEGLHQIGNSYSNLRLFHDLGVRYATLTHNCHNAFADAALFTNASGATIAALPYWNGLSKRGRVVIEEMNRIGMLVDLAHVSVNTMRDVLGGNQTKYEGSKSPVIFSHSSAYAICPHPRNVPDDVLRLVKKTKSIVMVNFSPDFISCTSSKSLSGLPKFYPENSTLHQVARHITYIGDLIGYDYVGLGSDFDGIFDTPAGLDDVGKFPDLVAELLRMGVTDEDAAKIVGQNILRVWADVEKMASKMQQEGVLPAEDEI